MFPVAWPVIVVFLVFGAFVSMAAGALSGRLAPFCLRPPTQGLLKTDSLLGLLGFVLGMFVPVLVRPLGLFFINDFVDPYLVAWIVAALLPLVREVLRFGQARSYR